MATSTKHKVLVTMWPPDKEYYNQVVVPKFPDLELCLSSTPLITKEEFQKSIEGASGLVHATVKFALDEETINKLPDSVKIIANHGAGYDGVNLPAATKRGIWVSNTPHAVDDSTADVAFILILNATRRVYEAETLLRSGKWVEKQLNDFMMGHELRGKKLGVVGMGGIGKETAKRATAFGMEILYHNRKRLDAAQETAYAATFCATFHELLAQADVVSVHTPYSQETHYLFGEKEFSAMKKGSYIVNTARGKVINTEALVGALRSGHLAGAGLDVFETEPLGEGWKELREMKNVTLLPHLGTCTNEARFKMLELCLKNVSAVLKGHAPVTPVNKI
eukprot:Phypoly_transcript_12118.p1 GENE.Phypoly_transcript_12118~~Phypoly_transcript_12118.p1  ORF type:complete len:336 (+),score=63.28 Phypoly_transcript_12118:146-1153(+)